MMMDEKGRENRKRKSKKKKKDRSNLHAELLPRIQLYVRSMRRKEKREKKREAASPERLMVRRCDMPKTISAALIRLVSRHCGAGNASRTAKVPNLDAFARPQSAVLDDYLLALVSCIGPCLCPAGPWEGILRGDEPRSCASDSLMVTAVAWGALLTQAETIWQGSPMVRILTDASQRPSPGFSILLGPS